MENRPSEGGSVVTDRDLAPINCNYSAGSNPSGCGRVDDTFRAAMVSRGNFLAAPSVDQLRQGIVTSFQAIGTTDGSATSITGRSSSVLPGDRFFSAGYRTSTWIGRVQSYDAQAYRQSSGLVARRFSQRTAKRRRIPQPAERRTARHSGELAADLLEGCRLRLQRGCSAGG
jgi:hypothetical protein